MPREGFGDFAIEPPRSSGMELGQIDPALNASCTG